MKSFSPTRFMILLAIATIIAVPVVLWVATAGRPVSPFKEELLAHAREQAPMVISDLDRVVRVEIRRARTIEWQAGGMVSPAEATTEAMGVPELQGIIDGAKDKRALESFTRELRAIIGNEKRIRPTSIGGFISYGIRLYLDDGYYYDCSFGPSDPNDFLMINQKFPPKMKMVRKEIYIKNVSIAYRSTGRFRQLVLDSLNDDARKKIVKK